MATNVFDFLVDVFKITPQQVSEYASQGTIYQLFYLFVFPTIMIVIFVWILTHAIIGKHKGFRILLSIGVYAFIILQGYYSWFVTFSKYWLFGLLILGFLYFISYRGGRGEGGGKGAQGLKSDGSGGVLGFLSNVTGKELNPKKKMEYEQQIGRDIELLKRNRATIQTQVDKLKHEPKAAEHLLEQLGSIDIALSTLQRFRETGDYADYERWKNTQHVFKV